MHICSMVLGFQGSNAVAETEGAGDRGPSTPPGIANDPVSEGLYEAKQIDLDMTTDNAKDGAVKAAGMADIVGDTAKQTLDGKWKAAQETSKKIKDTVTGKEHEAEGPNFDSSPDDSNIEDLRRRAGGYDEKEH